ncbi:unnamed protein product [Symbiodinium sp. CCMP2592]|nr:unnamed protein product [Symbiodinium sp. CCMP2592]
MTNMQDGIKDPPAHWLEKGDGTMVTMVLEKAWFRNGRPSARRTCLSWVVSVSRPSQIFPFTQNGGGHWSWSKLKLLECHILASCSACPPVPDHEVPDTAPWTPVPVKTEPGVFSSFARGIQGKRSADEDGDDFPAVGQADDED